MRMIISGLETDKGQGVRGKSMHGVCQQGGDLAGSAVSKGRAEGGEVRENSSG